MKIPVNTLLKFNLFDMIKIYSQNKEVCDSVMMKNSIEGYEGYDEDGNPENKKEFEEKLKKTYGLSVGGFMALLLLGLAIWIWALVAVIKFWGVLPTWAKVVGLLGLFHVIPGFGPVITLIVVYASKSVKK